MKKSRIAVVGGGPGGLFTSYLLKEFCGDLCQVTLFEAGPRLGGKVRHRAVRHGPGPIRGRRGRALRLFAVRPRSSQGNSSRSWGSRPSRWMARASSWETRSSGPDATFVSTSAKKRCGPSDPSSNVAASCARRPNTTRAIRMTTTGIPGRTRPSPRSSTRFPTRTPASTSRSRLTATWPPNLT